MPSFFGSILSGALARQPAGTAVRQGNHAELVVSQLLPRYAEVNRQGKAVYQARATLVATSLVGTAMVGLQLYNPSSTMDLIILKLGGSIVATSATKTGVVLASGTGQLIAPTSQTAISRQQNGYITSGAPTGVGIAYNAGTFTNAPVAFMDLLHNTAAIAATGEDPGYFVPIEGSIIVGPLSYVAFAALGGAGAAASNNHWIEWLEAPVAV